MFEPDHEVVVVGAGFAGLGMAIELKRSGEQRFVVIEQGDSVGGTWRENTYPGCACDVPSHLYSYSFAPNPDWSRAFSPQPEIRAYLERCATEFGIRPHLRLRTKLSSARFDADAGLWRLELDGGAEQLTTRALVIGLGALRLPGIPAFPGIDSFGGEAFHSAEWPDDVDLTGKRVAVVGTGASAIQIVPAIAPVASHVDVYQRTPTWILPRRDREFSPLQRRLLRHLPGLRRLYRASIYCGLELSAPAFTKQSRGLKLGEGMALRHLRRQVPDPELRRKLTPSFRLGCKRVLLSDDYYPALMRDDVSLVTDAIERVGERGIVTRGGEERPADVIVFGTGFRIQDMASEVEIVGAHGRDLDAHWKEEAMQAHRGTTVAGFPNLFVLLGPNTGLGHNSIVYVIESQLRYVLEALKTIRERRLAWVDVRPEAQLAYNERLQGELDGAVWTDGGCRSWYVDERGRNFSIWPGHTFAFRRATRRFDVESYDCQPLPARQPVAA